MNIEANTERKHQIGVMKWRRDVEGWGGGTGRVGRRDGRRDGEEGWEEGKDDMREID